MTKGSNPRPGCLVQVLAALAHLGAGGVLLVASPILLLFVGEGLASLDRFPENLGPVLSCGGALLLGPLSLLIGLGLVALGRPGWAALLQVVVLMLLGCAGVLGSLWGKLVG